MGYSGLLVFKLNSGDESTLFDKFRVFFTIHSLVGPGLVFMTGMAACAVFVYQGTVEQARAFSELVNTHVAASIPNGDQDRRELYLEKLAATPGIEKLHIFGSDATGRPFGLQPETRDVMNAVEKEVLRSGVTRTEWLQRGLNTSVRVTRPLNADGLGGISITFNAGNVIFVAIASALALILLMGLFIMLSLRLLRNRFEPLSVAANETGKVVERAIDGDFSGRVKQLTPDDVGTLATGVNQLMHTLQQAVGGITTDIAALLNYEFDRQEKHNGFSVAREMVSSLVQISRFRRAIEEDENDRDVYRRFGATLGDVFGIRRYSIYETDAKMNRMVPALIDGEENREVCYCDSQILLRADACRVKRTGHAVDNFESGDICSLYRGPEKHKHLCIPVHHSSGIGDVLQLVISEHEQHHAKTLRPYIEAYLREAGTVIESKRMMKHLRESSLRDPLTGLYNRRFLTEFEGTLVATLQRRLTHAVILMVDLDYFKQVNDEHGHVAGDKVLREMARVMQQSVRSSDLAVRYGGEEFMLLLLDAEADNGLKVAEKVRANIAKTRVKLADVELGCSVSIGVADYPGDSDDFWQCVKYADVALYQAKEMGRNRAERYFAEMWDWPAGAPIKSEMY